MGGDYGGWGRGRTERQICLLIGSEKHRPITNDKIAKRNKRRFLYHG